MSYSTLAKVLEELTPPCETFRCKSHMACADHEMACESYVVWQRTGRLVPTPDSPNGFNYVEVFKK